MHMLVVITNVQMISSPTGPNNHMNFGQRNATAKMRNRPRIPPMQWRAICWARHASRLLKPALSPKLSTK